MNVFTDTSLLESRKIVVKNEEKVSFLQRLYQAYIQSVIDHIYARVESTDFILSMSVFHPRHLPKREEELSTYGMEKIKVLTRVHPRS